MNRKKIAKGKLVRRFGINIFEQPKYDKILKKSHILLECMEKPEKLKSQSMENN